MSRTIMRGMQRAVESILGATMLILPSRLHWSRHSSAVLAAAGVTLIGAGIAQPEPRGRVARVTRSLARNRHAIVGVTLFGVQYLLTEEESLVRGIIAGLGWMLVVFGLLVRWTLDEPTRPDGAK